MGRGRGVDIGMGGDIKRGLGGEVHNRPVTTLERKAEGWGMPKRINRKEREEFENQHSGHSKNLNGTLEVSQSKKRGIIGGL